MNQRHVLLHSFVVITGREKMITDKYNVISLNIHSLAIVK